MNYKILINKNAVPVLIEASNNADPDTWFSLEDEFHHIRFKDEEQVRNLLSPEEFRLHRIGQTFPLPTGYKVSFEKFSMIVNDWINCDQKSGDNVRAILSKLEEDKVAPVYTVGLEGINVNKADMISNRFPTHQNFTGPMEEPVVTFKDCVFESVAPSEEVKLDIDYKIKYEKCIEVIKRIDAGIITMYDL